jgi:hypothetical protein
MDQKNIAIAVGGIIVSLGILAVGFNKLSPDTYGNDTPIFDSFKSTFDYKNTYPGSKRDEILETDYDDELFDQPRRSDNSTSVMVGGRTLCKRCSTRNTRKNNIV